MLLIFVDIAALVLFVMVAEVFVFFKLYEDAFFLPFAFLFVLAVLLYKKLDSLEQAMSEERRARAEYAERKRVTVVAVTLALLLIGTMVVYTFWRRTEGKLSNPFTRSVELAEGSGNLQREILDSNKLQLMEMQRELPAIHEEISAVATKFEELKTLNKEIADGQNRLEIDTGKEVGLMCDLLAELQAINRNLETLQQKIEALK